MTDPDTERWKAEFSGRERVRMVVETLDEPATVTEIADRADVAWGTADSEIDRLLAERKVRKHTADGRTMYAPNPVQMLFEELEALIHENSRDALEADLAEYQSRIESLQTEYEVETLSELRDTLVSEDLSAAELRDVRNAASTWDALETEIRLRKHALQLYDDVTRLSESDGDERLAAS